MNRTLELVPTREAETVTEETRPEDRRDGPPERRASASDVGWRDPKFLVQIIMLVGAILSFYMLSERRTTTLEIAAANLNEKATRIEGQLGTIVTSVQSVTTATTRLQVKIESLEENDRDVKQAVAELKAHIDVLRSRTDKLDARTERMP